MNNIFIELPIRGAREVLLRVDDIQCVRGTADGGAEVFVGAAKHEVMIPPSAIHTKIKNALKEASNA